MDQQSSLSYFLPFIYGAKVKVSADKKTHTALMMLNPSNNFFLEFIQYKDKLKIKKTLFLPYIKNTRAKLEDNKLKIRMSNELESVYLIFKNPDKMLALQRCLEELVATVKPLEYAIYSYQNLLYYALYELKIYKNKDKIFSERDAQFVLKAIKIRKKKLKSRSVDRLSHMSNEWGLVRTLSAAEEEQENIKYCDYIKKKLLKLFSKNSTPNMKVIRGIFNILNKKNELYVLFEKYATKNKSARVEEMNDDLISVMINETMEDILIDDVKTLNIEGLMRFIQEVQRETVDGELIEQLNSFFSQIRMTSIFQKLPDHEVDQITFDEFSTFMFSHLNSAFEPDKKKIYMDLNHPLSHYFAHTSHNTYLVGHQLYGKSTIEGIERAVEQGVRCIEMDCWDGKDFEPVVTHGHTLTKEIPFKLMCEKLAAIAFKKNKFPLILSLETHCAIHQREKLAHYLKKSFGKRLLILNEEAVNKTFKLSQLMKTVLVKTESNFPETFHVRYLGGPPKLKPFDNDTLSGITCLFKENIAMKELSTPFSMISTSESKFFTLLSDPEETTRVRAISNKHLIRVYPDAKRFSSTNYNPLDAWHQGVQLVALNIQCRDEFALVNKIKFQENGGAHGGFILKPAHLRNDALPVLSEFTIEVVSGQIISKSLLDENDFLEVYVIGPKKEHANQKYTLNFSANFIHPAVQKNFSGPMKFVVLYPELSFLVFKARNATENIKQIGILPISCARQGIRVLELYDRHFFLNKYSYLLLKINKR